MSFILNPFSFASGFPNLYSMQLSKTATTANMQRFYISSKTNNIDTRLRLNASTFGLTFWFKLNESGANTTLFSKYDDFNGLDRCFKVYIDGSNRLTVYGQTTSATTNLTLTTTQTFTTNTWYHIGFTYNGNAIPGAGSQKLYVNSSEVTSFAVNIFELTSTNRRFWNQTTAANRANTTIGCEYAGASQGTPTKPTSANIDDFTFWNIQLSQAQITELYNSGNPYNVSTSSAYTNCIVWYRMGDNNGDVFSTNWTIINVKGVAGDNLTSLNVPLSAKTTSVY